MQEARKLLRYETADGPFDFYDAALGRHLDLWGPVPREYFRIDSIVEKITESRDCDVILDLAGLTKSEIAEVEKAIQSAEIPSGKKIYKLY